MADKVKRQRGRPVGTGKADEQTLACMADLMVRDRALRPTTAAKRVVRGVGPSHLRRLQVKWQAAGGDLLSAAQARATQSARAEAERHTNGNLHGQTAVGAVYDYENTSIMQAMRAYENSPMGKLMRDYENSPMAKLMREMENNPATRLMREMENNPATRLMREMENNPATRLMREMENSPVTRLMRK